MGRISKFSTKDILKYVLRCIEEKDSITHNVYLIGISKTNFETMELLLLIFGYRRTKCY